MMSEVFGESSSELSLTLTKYRPLIPSQRPLSSIQFAECIKLISIKYAIPVHLQTKY